MILNVITFQVQLLKNIINISTTQRKWHKEAKLWLYDTNNKIDTLGLRWTQAHFFFFARRYVKFLWTEFKFKSVFFKTFTFARFHDPYFFLIWQISLLTHPHPKVSFSSTLLLNTYSAWHSNLCDLILACWPCWPDLLVQRLLTLGSQSFTSHLNSDTCQFFSHWVKATGLQVCSFFAQLTLQLHHFLIGRTDICIGLNATSHYFQLTGSSPVLKFKEGFS